MRSRTQALFYFLSTIAAVVITLLLLNWLPLALKKDTLRKYDSIEEARAKLNLKNVLVPTYFPQTIFWPPSEVLAQSKPFPAMLIVFSRAGSREPALVVSQAGSDSFPGNAFITLTQVREKVQYRLKDRNAVLEVGTCGSETCSRISWTEAEARIALTMRSAPFELIKIADSMLR